MPCPGQVLTVDEPTSEAGAERMRQHPAAARPERLEAIVRGAGGILLERIVSHGQTSPDGFWYDQEQDEWVMVLEGEAKLAFEDGRELGLSRGQSVFLPRRLKHRVTYTSSPCIWLALFGDELREAGPETENDKERS